MQPFPAGRFDEKAFPGLWPARVPELRDEPFASLDELDDAVAHRAIVGCVNYANHEFGVLSLTETSQQNTMWTHYADNHRGVVVEFDGTHPYFVCLGTILLPIEYSDQPISVSLVNGLLRIGGFRFKYEKVLRGEITEIPLQLLLRKKLEWAYEREWRMIQRLANCDERRDNFDPSRCAVSLFSIPKQAIKALIFGLHADHELKKSVKADILASSDWRHLALRERKQSAYGVIDEVEL